MGRRAKYLTAEDKNAARQEQKRRYRASDKGKKNKAATNKRYYESRKAATPLPSTSSITYSILPNTMLPEDLLSRATKVFRAAHYVDCGSGPLLGLWAPPYQFIPPSRERWDALAEHEEEGPWGTPEAILGSFQTDEIVKAGREHISVWRSEAVEVIETDLRDELSARVKGWATLHANPGICATPEAREAALDWGAKIIIMLAEEWEYRVRGGGEGYFQAFRESTLPWQRLMREIGCLYESENPESV